MLDASETHLMLPPPRVTTGGGKHEHEIDPYQTPAGAVPGKTSNVQETRKPLKRRETKEDLAAKEQAKQEMRVRGKRYAQYLELMAQNGGNRVLAVSLVYCVTVEEAAENLDLLLADLRSGRGSTDIAIVLEQHDLDVTARVNMLSKHMYSDVPAASLKAIQMAGEMEGDRGTVGAFEDFLRLAKAQNSK